MIAIDLFQLSTDRILFIDRYWRLFAGLSTARRVPIYTAVLRAVERDCARLVRTRNTFVVVRRLLFTAADDDRCTCVEADRQSPGFESNGHGRAAGPSCARMVCACNTSWTAETAAAGGIVIKVIIIMIVYDRRRRRRRSRWWWARGASRSPTLASRTIRALYHIIIYLYHIIRSRVCIEVTFFGTPNCFLKFRRHQLRYHMSVQTFSKDRPLFDTFSVQWQNLPMVNSTRSTLCLPEENNMEACVW